MCQDSEELSVRGARVPEKNPAAESNAYERKNIPGRQMTSPVPSMNNETGAVDSHTIVSSGGGNLGNRFRS